ncbi:scarecrow-like protein 23 [Bidens hawaiensis]|uniref:scarecrow-like protein 23 n=1 Tax=Bidens hawaiensis TaxID=980011 RepID=UPI0040495CCB
MFPSKNYDNPFEPLQLDKTKNDQQKPSRFGAIDNLYFDFASTPYQNMIKGADFQLEDDQGVKRHSPFASLRIVKDYASRSRKLNGEKIHIPSSNTAENDRKLSTIERIRMAGLHFIDSYSNSDEISNPNHAFPFSSSGLSDDEAKDINLLLTLLASANKTGQQHFNEAIKLIESCNNTSSNEGTTVQRLVYYFSEAIREKINREIGRDACDGLERMQMFDLQKALMGINASILAFHQKVPMAQVCQFTSIHTILENLGRARHVHVIDLEIRSGMQYTVLMQAIASRSEWQLKHLKITAIGTRSESRIKDTCNHLADFARSKSIPFSFEIVMVPDMLDFNINLLELDRNEKIAVYSAVSLSSLIVTPNRLEHLMRELRKINPCITVITEVEANHTSATFVNRFIDALFFYGALFDSLSVCLGNDEVNRKVAESVYYAYSIRNIVAAEGDDRTIRHTGIDVWRAFFARFGMAEIELSGESLNEAKLLIDNFECANCCQLPVDGRCLVVDWNGVPMFSVSAWKFI